MGKSKKYIIILTILLCVIGMVIGILSRYLNKINGKTEKQPINQIAQKDIFISVDDYRIYYTIKGILNKYILYMKQVNGDTYVNASKLNMTAEKLEDEMQNDGIKAIKKILDEQYINDLNVTDNQIKNLQYKYVQNGGYTKEVEYNLNIDDVLINGMAPNIKLALINARLNGNDLNLIIKLDTENDTYSIFLEDYISKYNYKKDMNEKDITIGSEQIQKNTYNRNINIDPTESYIVSQYFSEYKTKMLNDAEEAYKLLDKEYGQKKYGSYENFKHHIDTNRENIEYASIDKYQITEHSGMKEYVCLDKEGRYYIFIEEEVSKYRVILDTYTIDLPEFLEKYQKNDYQIKAGMNIQKVFDAINDGDYKYAYNKLDETFRNNNFPIFDKFVENFGQKFFEKNTFEYQEIKQEGNSYTIKVLVWNQKDVSEKKNITFAMRLLEGTNFEISFNIEK